MDVIYDFLATPLGQYVFGIALIIGIFLFGIWFTWSIFFDDWSNW